jgi:hypothetical protein
MVGTLVDLRIALWYCWNVSDAQAELSFAPQAVEALNHPAEMPRGGGVLAVRAGDTPVTRAAVAWGTYLLTIAES